MIKKSQFNIASVKIERTIPYMKPNIFKRFWYWLQNIRYIQFNRYEVALKAGVGPLPKKGDVFIAAHNTAWCVTESGQGLLKCYSLKPYPHCEIVGPALIVANTYAEQAAVAQRLKAKA